jgi:hypothetical protein
VFGVQRDGDGDRVTTLAADAQDETAMAQTASVTLAYGIC